MPDDDEFDLPPGTSRAGELDEDGAARLKRIAALSDEEVLEAFGRFKSPDFKAERLLVELELEIARRGLTVN